MGHYVQAHLAALHPACLSPQRSTELLNGWLQVHTERKLAYVVPFINSSCQCPLQDAAQYVLIYFTLHTVWEHKLFTIQSQLAAPVSGSADPLTQIGLDAVFTQSGRGVT